MMAKHWRAKRSRISRLFHKMVWAGGHTFLLILFIFLFLMRLVWRERRVPKQYLVGEENKGPYVHVSYDGMRLDLVGKQVRH